MIRRWLSTASVSDVQTHRDSVVVGQCPFSVFNHGACCVVYPTAV